MVRLLAKTSAQAGRDEGEHKRVESLDADDGADHRITKT